MYTHVPWGGENWKRGWTRTLLFRRQSEMAWCILGYQNPCVVWGF
ncbi:mCG1027730 [Mus musculus]|nr:mCG1027730 [Mus musculus]